jgi:hypothetical protein
MDQQPVSFLLQEMLLEPSRVPNLEPGQFNQLIPQGRSSRLLASLALEMEQAGVQERVPAPVWRHFHSEVLVHDKQKHDLAYDTGKLQEALSSIGEKLILLKGGAYLMAGLPVGRGRLMSDIDIIVPQERIDEVEKTLNGFGWESSYVDTYNERYYRKWMHEIPPLANRKRGTTLDLHHTILPPTAAANLDARLLFEDVMEVKPGIFTLSWQDMVIHSATHLFHEGEFHHGLRDVWDLDRMLRDFPGRDPQFWDNLVTRARQLDLLGSLFHGLTYSRAIFSTPIPAEVLEEANNWSRAMRKPLMDFLFLRAFRPDQPECKLPFTDLALNLLYIRPHYLRMPLYLLIPHLARKTWMKRFGEDHNAPEKGKEVPGEA